MVTSLLSSPASGTMAGVPGTRRALAAHIGFYLVVAAGCLVLLREDFGASPDWQFRLGSAAAVLLPVIVLVALADIVGMLVVRARGRTPSGAVVFGFGAAVATLGLALSWQVSEAALRYLTEERDFWNPIEEVLWASPIAVVAFSIALWARYSFVTRWQILVDAAQRETREANLARELAEAQLARLQAQIEPHFLFNTLASVQYLVQREPGSANYLLTQLVRYLRHAMPKLRQPMSTLGQEFQLADAYLQIARMRMGGRLSVEVELPEALHDLPFPPLVLQTLVENALKHGVEPKPGNVSIQVSGRVAGDSIVLQVLDDGVGLVAAPRTAGTGTGLPNIRGRLAGIYGDGATLVVTGREQGGAESTVRVALDDHMRQHRVSERGAIGDAQRSQELAGVQGTHAAD